MLNIAENNYKKIESYIHNNKNMKKFTLNERLN